MRHDSEAAKAKWHKLEPLCHNFFARATLLQFYSCHSHLAAILFVPEPPCCNFIRARATLLKFFACQSHLAAILFVPEPQHQVFVLVPDSPRHTFYCATGPPSRPAESHHRAIFFVSPFCTFRQSVKKGCTKVNII